MLTPHCSAASGMVAPLSIAATTRLRKSSEYGFAIHAGLLPVGSLNHIRAGLGIPDSAFSGNALMLLIAYGLRAGEVGGLRLDDLDWKNEMLRVRCPKPGRTH